MQILNWLVSDFSVFGLRIQYWMLAFILLFAVILFFALLDRQNSADELTKWEAFVGGLFRCTDQRCDVAFWHFASFATNAE
jgi:hypothetical protein